MLAWVFFRAADLTAATTVISGLTAFGVAGGIDLIIDPALLFVMAFASVIVLFAPNSLDVAGYAQDLRTKFPQTSSPAAKILQPTPLSALSTAIMLTGGILVAWKPAVFIYFNF